MGLGGGTDTGIVTTPSIMVKNKGEYREVTSPYHLAVGDVITQRKENYLIREIRDNEVYFLSFSNPLERAGFPPTAVKITIIKLDDLKISDEGLRSKNPKEVRTVHYSPLEFIGDKRYNLGRAETNKCFQLEGELRQAGIEE
jgi:hypothetical protein